jgi:hypothetical protein
VIKSKQDKPDDFFILFFYLKGPKTYFKSSPLLQERGQG